MSLNWSIGIIISFISSIPMISIAIIFLLQYRKNKLVAQKLMAVDYMLNFAWALLNGISLLLLSGILYIIATIISVIQGILIVIIIDIATRESIEPIKTNIMTALGMAWIIILMVPGNMLIGTNLLGELDFYFSPIYSIFRSLFLLSFIIAVTYFFIIIIQNAPRFFKKKTLSFALGFVINVVIGISLIAFVNIEQLIPRFDTIIVAIGAALLSFPVYKYPQLFFVIPFKAVKLSIIDIRNGITLFSHEWSQIDKEGEEQLFSGLLQGFRLFFNESLKLGDIKEIKLDRGILILYKKENIPVAFAIISSKSSKTLRNSLEKFAEGFIEEFKDDLEPPHNISKFKSTSKLIDKYFFYIPEYD